MGPIGAHTHIDIIKNDSPSNEGEFVRHVIHEFGHALGFAHEMERPDNFGMALNGSGSAPWPSALYCSNFQSDRARPYFNGVYSTPNFDPDSIMSYCSTAQHLSNEDIYGAIATYGRRTTTRGFLIVSQNNASLAVRGTGTEGSLLTLATGCTTSDSNCTWTYRDGMLVSDANPLLAINAWGGAGDGTVLRLTQWCEPTNPDCTWTYTHGHYQSDRNLALSIVPSAGGGAGDNLVIRSGCTDSNLACTWRLPGLMVSPHNRPMYNLNAWGGATFGAYLRWTDLCVKSNPDCLWNFEKGMITSVNYGGLAINAFGGASEYQYLRLHDGCSTANPDCTWTLSRSGLRSDNTSNGTLNATGDGGYVGNGDALWLRKGVATKMDGLYTP